MADLRGGYYDPVYRPRSLNHILPPIIVHHASYILQLYPLPSFQYSNDSFFLQVRNAGEAFSLCITTYVYLIEYLSVQYVSAIY